MVYEVSKHGVHGFWVFILRKQNKSQISGSTGTPNIEPKHEPHPPQPKRVDFRVQRRNWLKNVVAPCFFFVHALLCFLLLLLILFLILLKTPPPPQKTCLEKCGEKQGLVSRKGIVSDRTGIQAQRMQDAGLIILGVTNVKKILPIFAQKESTSGFFVFCVRFKLGGKKILTAISLFFGCFFA